MLLIRTTRAVAFSLIALALFGPACARARAQAAMLMAEPFGFFCFLNPTGHDAIYFHRIAPRLLLSCAAARPVNSVR